MEGGARRPELSELADLEQATPRHCTTTAHLEKGEAPSPFPQGARAMKETDIGGKCNGG